MEEATQRLSDCTLTPEQNPDADIRPLTAEEQLELGRAYAAIRYLRELDPRMHTRAARLLISIALEPGITVQELQEKTQLAQSSCSRNIARFSRTDRHGRPGLGLVVAHVDPADHRRHRLYLTPKGEKHMAVIADLLK